MYILGLIKDLSVLFAQILNYPMVATMFFTFIFFLLVAVTLAMDNTGPFSSSDSVFTKELERLADIDKVGQPLFVNTFLGKREEVQQILGGYPEYLSEILDCNNRFKCPLEIAIMRGHYAIANLLLAHMKIHIPHTCIEDLFLRWNTPMIQNMISRGDKEAVKFILDTIINEKPDGDGIETKFGGMTALYYAKQVNNREMILYLTEIGCKDEPDVFASDNSSTSKKDSPRKAKSDGILISSGSPRKSSGDNLATATKSSSTKRRFSSPRLHIDLHFRPRSSSLTASSSPRKSTSKSPREKIEKKSSRSSISATDSPRTSDGESQGTDDLDGSSRVESDTGGSSSSADSTIIKKKNSGSLRARSKK